MIVTETQAKIDGDVDHFVKVGGTLRLSCRVYLGHQGPDDVYAKTAVIHWFHDQRLLDPDLENWKSSRTMTDQREHFTEGLKNTREVCTKGIVLILIMLIYKMYWYWIIQIIIYIHFIESKRRVSEGETKTAKTTKAVDNDRSKRKWFIG